VKLHRSDPPSHVPVVIQKDFSSPSTIFRGGKLGSLLELISTSMVAVWCDGERGDVVGLKKTD
jgi:hypothetical protein